FGGSSNIFTQGEFKPGSFQLLYFEDGYIDRFVFGHEVFKTQPFRSMLITNATNPHDDNNYDTRTIDSPTSDLRFYIIDHEDENIKLIER
ncbi:MAG: hypothetical protein AAF705_12795, partial [Bacteroidota bacterium]